MRNSNKFYKDEMKKMKNHRKLYRPMLLRFLSLHDSIKNTGTPVELTEADDMMLVVELVDLGFFDIDAVEIVKKGYTILKVIYFGKYPLSESGEKLLEDESQSSGMKKIKYLLGRFLTNPGDRFKL